MENIRRFHIYLFVISVFYAWFENVFDWKKVVAWFDWFAPRINLLYGWTMSGYTYIFMPIFIVSMIWLYPIQKKLWHYIYGITFFALFEDVLYFVWRMELITALNWTSRILGAVDFGYFAIPNWYFIALPLLLGSYKLVKNGCYKYCLEKYSGSFENGRYNIRYNSVGDKDE